MGRTSDGIASFRGIPYAASTGDRNRFRSPQKRQWTGVHDATAFGSPAPQALSPSARSPLVEWIIDFGDQSEDCLVLNVWTPSIDVTAKLPVMVFVHGGGFSYGGAGARGLDGANLARHGAVVVTVNHRLNVFGHLYLGDALGDERADAGNAGILDLIEALRWVRSNIEEFGGDPDLVTLLGQSGGGSKVAAVLAAPSSRGLVSRAVIQSASSMHRLADLHEAEENRYYFFRELGLAKRHWWRILDLPTDVILDAMGRAIKAAGDMDNYRPVVDGRTIVSQPFEDASLDNWLDVPLVVGTCETEHRLHTARDQTWWSLDFDEVSARISRFLGVSDRAARELLSRYAQARPTDTPAELGAQVIGDQRYLRGATDAATAKARIGGAPVFLYQMQWRTPVHDGRLQTPHALCLPYVFSNVESVPEFVGSDRRNSALQELLSEAWVSFARTGRPSAAAWPIWPAFTPVRRPTFVIDDPSRVVEDLARDELEALERCPPYLPASSEATLRHS